MGSAHSRGVCGFETGFLPQFHLLRISEGDTARLFIPLHLVSRCSLLPSQEVALVDCLGRTRIVEVENCTDVYYLGRGWERFLQDIGAVKGDCLLFEFAGVRTCKVFQFNGMFGWQKYPLIEEQDMNMVLHPREPRCFFSGGWPHPDSPTRAISAGPCTMVSASSSAATPSVDSYTEVCGGNVFNHTGQYIDPIMLEFLEHLVAESNLQMSLYYCKLGAIELEAGFLALDRGYSKRYISKLMNGSFSKHISIRRCKDTPVNGRLFVDFDGRAYISDGWLNFVRQQSVLQMAECVLQFVKEEENISLSVRIVCSSYDD